MFSFPWYFGTFKRSLKILFLVTSSCKIIPTSSNIHYWDKFTLSINRMCLSLWALSSNSADVSPSLSIPSQFPASLMALLVILTPTCYISRLTFCQIFCLGILHSICSLYGCDLRKKADSCRFIWQILIAWESLRLKFVLWQSRLKKLERAQTHCHIRAVTQSPNTCNDSLTVLIAYFLVKSSLVSSLVS